MKIGKLELDVLCWIGQNEVPELIGRSGDIDVEITSYRRSNGDVGSFTEFKFNSERCPLDRSFSSKIIIWYDREDTAVGCYLIPSDDRVTMELFVHGDGLIPSFETGYRFENLSGRT